MLYYILLSLTIIFLISLFKKFIFKKIKSDIPEDYELNEKIKQDLIQKGKLLLFVLMSLPLVVYSLNFIVEFDMAITFGGVEVPKFLWIITCFLLSHVIISKGGLI